MNATDTITALDAIAQKKALGHVFSDVNGLTYKEVIESLESELYNSNESLDLWYPFVEQENETVKRELQTLYYSFLEVAHESYLLALRTI